MKLDSCEIPRIKKSAFAMDANLSPRLRGQRRGCERGIE